MQQLLTRLSEMTIGEIVGSGMVIILIFTTLVEITPIKWNPLTSILSWLGIRMNGKLIAKVDEQGKQIKELDTKIDMNEIDRIRWEILSFAGSCRTGHRHTKDEFEHIIGLHEKYHHILTAHNMTNGLVSLEYEYIENIYRHCLEKNSFV